MKAVKKIPPYDFILAVLSPQEKLETAFKIAQEAFKGATFDLTDIKAAVKKVRRKVYEESKEKAKGSS